MDLLCKPFRWPCGSGVMVPSALPSTAASEVVTKMILMGHPVLSCHVPVVRSCFILFRTLISSWKFCNVHLSLHVITPYIVRFSHLCIPTKSLFSLSGVRTDSMTSHKRSNPAISRSELVMALLWKRSLISLGHSHLKTVGMHASFSPKITPPTPWDEASHTTYANIVRPPPNKFVASSWGVWWFSKQRPAAYYCIP